ncbi:MAG: hypothetical protein MR316_05955 [Lachnospiraceae bacterium]|nr:hypothetical protein [Lachnospiraceae bacterium]
MRKLREWMHGQGRTIVITATIVAAICIVGNYFFVEKQGIWGPTPTPTPTPVPVEESIVGGESIGTAPSESPVVTETPTESPQ